MFGLVRYASGCVEGFVMSFILEVPPGRFKEREYAAEVVLGNFLGLEVYVRQWGEAQWRLRMKDGGSEARSLTLPDVFFRKAIDAWLSPLSIERLRDKVGKVAWSDLPLVFAGTGLGSREVDIGFDVLGAAFFMLSRYEELIQSRRDSFNRFEWASSCLNQEIDIRDPFLDRAVEHLRQKIEETWPAVKCRAPKFEVMVTHDVDALRNRGRSVSELLMACGADVLRRRSMLLAAKRAWSARPSSSAALDPADPFNTFDFLMSESERVGVRSHFYFVPGPRRHRYDPNYDVFQRDVQRLLRNIGARGHQIGLHASFDAAYREGGVEEEFLKLQGACELAGITQTEWGGRHHFLRWSPELSWRQWSEAGLAYDSSVGYAEAPGFRCGTARGFPVWDLREERRLDLWERPLILMEVSLFSYQHLSESAALERCMDLAGRCRKYGGTFVLLWHNHNLLTARSRETYRAMLSAACASN